MNKSNMPLNTAASATFWRIFPGCICQHGKDDAIFTVSPLKSVHSVQESVGGQY